MASVLRLGDRVSFDGDEHQVVGLAGTSVRLRAESGEQVVLAGHLMAAPDFAVVGAADELSVEPFGLLDALPDEAVIEAQVWEAHVLEVETGLPSGAVPRPEFDPAVRNLAQRQHAKAVELGVTDRTDRGGGGPATPRRAGIGRRRSTRSTRDTRGRSD